MQIKDLSTELGVEPIDDARIHELKNLNLLEIPGIRRRLSERERKLGTTEEEIENQVRLTANAIKSCLYSRSYYPYAKRLGKELRRMVVHELCLKHYRHNEIKIILGVSGYTVRRDIRATKAIKKKEWWYQIFSWENMEFLVTKEWEFYTPYVSG